MSAINAFKNVFFGGTGFNHQRRSRVSFDPTSGTLIFRANLDLKVQKPIWRGARTIALHPEFLRSPLDCKVFLLKAQRSMMLASSNPAGFFANYALN
jgi:hypothetical protein